MSDTLPELLAAAKRSPTDDAPRRAVADHLSANGDPDRGEFVRLQLAQAGDGDWHPNQSDEQVTQGRLLKKHVRRWAGVPYAGPYWFKFADTTPDEDDDTPHASGRFDRGFLRVTGTPAAVREALDRVPPPQGEWLEMIDLNGVAAAADLRALLAHPVGGRATAFDVSAVDDAPADVFDPLDREGVRELRLTGTNGAVLRRLAAFKAARPHTLSIEFDADDPSAAEAFLASAALADVRDAEISLDEQDPKLLSALARTPHLRRLHRLSLSGDELPGPLLREFFASDAVRELRRLSVSGYSGHLHGVVAALVQGGAARRVTALDLGFNTVTTEEADALAKSDLFASLTTLDLGSGELTGDGAAALFRSPNAAGLERLILSGTEIGEEAVFALAQSPHLKNLKELDLCRCGVTAKAIRALAQSPHLANLERLDLSINPLAPFALDALSGSRTLGKLKSLGLRQLVIANDTFDRLFRSPVVAKLEHLDLQGTMLSKAKLRGLVEATTLTAVRKVTFGENILMKGEIDVLGEAGWLSQVADLALYNTKMTDAGVRTLTAKLPAGRLGRLDLGRNFLTDASAEALLNWGGLAGLTDLSLYQSGLSDPLAARVRRAAWGNG
jgi:uncharacterized protein (TIGR02996 family)